MKSHNYRCLQIIAQQRAEPEFAHAVDQDPRIVTVAATSAWLPTFGEKLFERAVEGHDHVYRRREPILAVCFEALPLIVEIKHERGRIALGFAQCVASADDKAKPRYAFDAFV